MTERKQLQISNTRNRTPKQTRKKHDQGGQHVYEDIESEYESSFWVQQQIYI